MNNQRSVMQAGLAMLLLTGLWLAYVGYANSKQKLIDRSAELAQATSVIEEIEFLRTQPDQAILASHSVRALAQAIEQSAEQAKIPSGQIASIEPQSPRRASDTPYMEYGTVVQLEGITLAQFAQLAVSLRRLDASLGQIHLTTIRIDTPYHQGKKKETQECWNVEITLTYFVYSPKSSGPRAS